MKFIALILSIYILALNFAPCEDIVALENDIKVEISQNVIIDLDQNHNELDLCSPFCQCLCCHIHITNFNLDDFTVSPEKISTKIFSHFDDLGKDISNSILQPPRV
ncbi:hypothetical protein JYT89_00955 [Flavobacteriaceae bacterium AH-315-B10]|nr:hypothetical protein [Flavobacteriaceae bacterium AH-315-B10]